MRRRKPTRPSLATAATGRKLLRGRAEVRGRRADRAGASTLDDAEAAAYDPLVNFGSGEEFHMRSDRANLVMRRNLMQLLAEHGATERPGA